jgi:hypothetical protein
MSERKKEEEEERKKKEEWTKIKIILDEAENFTKEEQNKFDKRITSYITELKAEITKENMNKKLEETTKIQKTMEEGIAYVKDRLPKYTQIYTDPLKETIKKGLETLNTWIKGKTLSEKELELLMGDLEPKNNYRMNEIYRYVAWMKEAVKKGQNSIIDLSNDEQRNELRNLNVLNIFLDGCNRLTTLWESILKRIHRHVKIDKLKEMEQNKEEKEKAAATAAELASPGKNIYLENALRQDQTFTLSIFEGMLQTQHSLFSSLYEDIFYIEEKPDQQKVPARLKIRSSITDEIEQE